MMGHIKHRESNVLLQLVDMCRDPFLHPYVNVCQGFIHKKNLSLATNSARSLISVGSSSMMRSFIFHFCIL